MGGWLAGLGAGAQGILGQRAANQQAGVEAQNLALDQATARINQQNALLEQQKFQQEQTQTAAKQKLIDQIARTNPMAAAALAAGINPRDLQAQAAKVLTKLGPDNKPHVYQWDPDKGTYSNDQGLAAPKASDTKPNITTTTEGLNNFREGIDPTTGAVLWKTPTGIKAPPAAVQERLLNSEDAAALGRAIVPLAKAIDPNDAKRLAAQATLYSYSGSPNTFYVMQKVLGPPDPRYFNLFSQLGQMGAALSKAYMGGRPSQQLFKIFSNHMPNPGDPPQVIIDKVKDLVGPNGTLSVQQDAINQMYGLAKQQAATGDMDEAGVGAAPESAASSSTEWSEPQMVRGPDGKPVPMRHNGSQWQKMDASGAWVPVNG